MEPRLVTVTEPVVLAYTPVAPEIAPSLTRLAEPPVGETNATPKLELLADAPLCTVTLVVELGEYDALYAPIPAKLLPTTAPLTVIESAPLP